MRDHVERDLFLKFLWFDLVADENTAALFEQFVHPVFARARHRLVGGHDHALDLGAVVQRLQRHYQLRGRTVGIGDNVALFVTVDRIGVHFGHDQRHVGVHAVQRRIVDDHTACGGGARRVDFGRARSGGEQRDIPPGEIEIIDVLYFEHLPGFAEFDLAALRTRRGQRGNLVDRKRAFGQDVEHFAPDITRRAHDCYPITHCTAPIFRRPAHHAGPGNRTPCHRGAR